MSKIRDVIFTPAIGAFFYDDQAAIRHGAQPDGATYQGKPLTPGFDAVRVAARCLSVGLVLESGAVVWGDCASVQYSGAAGRDPLLSPEETMAYVRRHLAERIVGLDAADAIENCDQALAAVAGTPVPRAIEYGLSQALLRAAAHSGGITIAEVICRAFGLPLPSSPVPIFAQSGDERYLNVDKMILKSVDILPHGLINSREKFGPQGQALREYAKWVAGRIKAIGGEGYRPVLHFDTYSWVGLGIGLSPSAIADYIARLADDVAGYTLHVECPADFGSTDAQLEGYAQIVAELARIGCPAKIVADEYCNTLGDVKRFCDAGAGHIIQIKTPDVGSIADTVRAILYAHEHRIGAYCGGTSAETDLSARACVHAAVAAQATMMLAKPGMGVDEGIVIVANEQNRLLETLKYRTMA